jgi:hypothetical protein
VVTPAGHEEQAQLQQLCYFPSTLQELRLATLTHAPAFVLDSVAVAACCPQLRDVELKWLTAGQLCSIGSMAHWSALESLAIDHTWLDQEQGQAQEQEQERQQLVAAIHLLPRLHTLSLASLTVSTSSQQWAQLAALPSLRSLEIHTLVVDGAAAPSASLQRLLGRLDVQLPTDRVDGSMAVLLPALQHLCSWSTQSIEGGIRAMRNHPSIQQLSLSGRDGSPPLPRMEQQLLRSMPRLHTLSLGPIHPGHLGTLLEDVSGCAQLQELELRLADDHSEHVAACSSSAAAGLAALASGPCKHSLRRITAPACVCCAFSPAQAAQLLLPDALPALQGLHLQAVVHAGGLLRRSARLQQASSAPASAAAAQPLPLRVPPGSSGQHLQLLVAGLQQAGVRELGDFWLECKPRTYRPGVQQAYFLGQVGQCAFSGGLWVMGSREDA